MVLGATLKGKVDIFDGVAMTSPLGPVLANISNYVPWGEVGTQQQHSPFYLVPIRLKILLPCLKTINNAANQFLPYLNSHVNRSQRQMGPFRNFGKRTVGHPLQDKWDSAELGIYDLSQMKYPLSAVKNFTFLVFMLYLYAKFSTICHRLFL